MRKKRKKGRTARNKRTKRNTLREEREKQKTGLKNTKTIGKSVREKKYSTQQCKMWKRTAQGTPLPPHVPFPRHGGSAKRKVQYVMLP